MYIDHFSKSIWALLTRILRLFTSATRMSTLGALLLLSFRFLQNVLSADSRLPCIKGPRKELYCLRLCSMGPANCSGHTCFQSSSLCSCPWFAKEKAVLLTVHNGACMYPVLDLEAAEIDASLRRRPGLSPFPAWNFACSCSTDDKSFVNAFSVISKIRCF